MALEGVDRLRSRENIKIYDGPFYLFFFTLDAGFTLNIPKMITDQLRRDNLS